jgi:hypothetical protein
VVADVVTMAPGQGDQLEVPIVIRVVVDLFDYRG